MQRTTIAALALLLPAFLPLAPAMAQQADKTANDGKAFVTQAIDRQRQHWDDVSRRIWGFHELGFQETQSSELLQQQLKDAGFEVKTGVSGMPTAFVATSGSGKPVIGILAEFDALPGLSQDTVPFRKPLEAQAPGHGCGHNLFGTASVAAAIAVRQWMEKTGQSGTIRLYGTPAEEGGDGKVYMVRDGLLADVDVVLAWHPSDDNDASPSDNLAVIGALFRFHGVSAHAAAAPDKGRSALDGVESFDYMVNMMREHVPQETRLHYVIRNGGLAPNVVPDFAEVEMWARHPKAGVLRDIWDRVVAASKGAALGTGTTVEMEIINGSYERLPNETIAKLMDANLRQVGGVAYTPAETQFAGTLQKSFGNDAPPLSQAKEIQPFERHQTYASSDAGDVSWNVPYAGLSTATWVPGTAAHSWQAVAADGMSIGQKGMIVAAKTVAMTAVDLFTHPQAIVAARAEFDRRRGPDFKYVSLIGDRKPALDYRKGAGGAQKE